MSLSKIKAFNLQSSSSGSGSFNGGSSSPFSNFPKWQLALIFGAPVLLLGLGSFWYWRSYKPEGKKVNSLSESSKKLQGVSSSVPTKKTDESSLQSDNLKKKPTFLILKDSGNELFKAGKYHDALQLYSKAIEEEPPQNPEDLAMLYQNRAAVHEKLGDFKNTISECTKALELNQKYVKALVRRSKAYKQTGFLDESLEDITAVCIIESFAHPSSVQLADDVLKELGEKEALRLAKNRKLVAPSPHAVNSFLRSFYNDPITLLWNQKSEDDSSSENSGDNTLSGYAAAVKKLQQRDYDSIIDLCTEEIENNPTSKDYIEAHHLRGTFRFLWGSKEGTVEDLTKVADSPLSSNLTKSSALLKLGSFYALQESEDYIKYFEQAETLTPDNVDVFHHCGQVLLTKGGIDEAVKQLAKATQMCPDFALAAASHLYILYRHNVYMENASGMDEVFKSFPKLLRKYPNSPDVFNLYGQVLMENQQFQAADQQFDKVLELDPSNASVYVHKAMAQFQINRDGEKMIQTLRDSLKMDDRNEFVYETLGTLELQRGNLDKSVEAIGKALEYAKSLQEMMMLSSLKKAAEVQVKIKEKLGLQTPTFPPLPNGQPLI